MTLCLVTDRRRLGMSLGVPPSGWFDLLVAQLRGAVSGHIDLVQLREPDLTARDLAALVRALMALVPGISARLVVNDRLDVALATGAAGVHLKECSLHVGDVRRLAPPGFNLGCSVHDATGARNRPDATYLIAGTVLPTVSKSPARMLEWDGLAEVVAASDRRPVLGIGGLTLADVPQLFASGAAGMAAIGAFIPARGVSLSEFVRDRAGALRVAFDSAPAFPSLGS